MNWLTKKVSNVIVTGLVLLSALFSCEDPSRLGIDLIDGDDDLGVLYVEIPLESKVVRMDSINTTNRGIMMTGDYTDNDFGNLKVQSYLRILPPGVSPDIPEAVLEADSLKMDLRILYYSGQSPASHQLSIHQLTEGLDPQKVYYSFDSSQYDPVSIVDTTFMITDADTLLSLDLFNLKDDLFQAMQEYQADSANAAEFLEEFKGLTLLSGKSSSAILGFNNQHPQSELTLYYTTNDTIVNTIDFTYSSYYHQITPDYTGTELEGIEVLTDFTPVSGNSYLQTGAGLVPKVDFTPYYDFIENDTTGTVVINQALLVMDDLQGLDGTIDPPQQMSFFYTNEANEEVLVGDEFQFPGTIQTDAVYISTTRNNLDPFNTSLRSVRAELDTADVVYRPEITLFLQLADGAFDRDDTDKVFSMPFSYVDAPTSVRDIGRNVDRFILPPNNLRLEIFYTRLR